MKKHLVFAVVPFLALGCGDELEDANGDGIADGVREPDTVTVVTPAEPKGTVSGQVLGTDLRPLDAVTVEMTIGSKDEPVSGTTDAKGNFEFKDVPAGAQVLLTFTKANYATLRASSVVPSSAGNVPINNGNASFGPITLARLDGSLSFLLVTPQGRPAANVRATLEATPAGSIILLNDESTTRVVSTVVVEATSNEQGLLSFTGIPGAAELARLEEGKYRLWVSPMDGNADGVADTGGAERSYTGGEVVANSSTRLIQLPFTRTGSTTLTVESSNVSSLRGAVDTDPLRNLLAPGEPIHLFFNQPVQQGSLLARLTDEQGKELLAVTATLTNGGYSATITPSQTLSEGREYNIDVRAVSAENGTTLPRSTGVFYVGTPSNPRTVGVQEIRYQETSNTAPTATQINPGEKIYVNFTSPVGSINLGGQAVQVFIDANIADASASSLNVIGDVPGELGNPQGYDLIAEEPTRPLATRTPPENAVFPLSAQSGYSTRYVFFYNNFASFPLNPTTTRMQVAFSKLAVRTIGTYESIWGQPITSDMSVTTVATQSPPTP
jgi:methionine-rich copper-binding protein CopC